MITSSSSGSALPPLVMNRASLDMNDTYYEVNNIDEQRHSRESPPVGGNSIMFTSLCAAFSNLDPIVPPLVRRHSSRWRALLSVVIGIMTFSASFAHLRYMMHRGSDRRVEERRNHSIRALFGGNPVQPPTELHTSTMKNPVPTNPRILLGATIACWTAWGVLVATHPSVNKQRRTVSVGDGSGRAILTCIVFIIACMLTYWTRIRYGETVAETVKA